MTTVRSNFALFLLSCLTVLLFSGFHKLGSALLTCHYRVYTHLLGGRWLSSVVVVSEAGSFESVLLGVWDY